MSSQIAQRIIEEIGSGVYLPGATLPSEQHLATTYGVSRPIVREAFKLLSAQGFLSVTTGKSAIIREVNDELLRVFMRRVLSSGSSTSIQDLFAVRIILEEMSAALAARNRTKKDLQQLGAALTEMKRYIDEPAFYSEFDIKFHVLLAQSSRNIFLFHLISSIRETLVSLGSKMRSNLSTAEIAQIHHHHISIYKAVEKGDSAEAVASMELHFETVPSRLKKYLKILRA
ncbi:MAG TPA: FadR/GntR family transcriptional regulator [Spirochaetia bacterium]|nr:FadR/GntR family transcriptional regulator [Spirochaetia bacterium]